MITRVPEDSSLWTPRSERIDFGCLPYEVITATSLNPLTGSRRQSPALWWSTRLSATYISIVPITTCFFVQFRAIDGPEFTQRRNICRSIFNHALNYNDINKHFLVKEHVILIIRGGTAGLALANRLSEDSGLSIGAIEAGADKSDDPVIQSGDLSTAIWQSSDASYLKVAEGRQNLNVLLEAFVRKIVLERGEMEQSELVAKGVEFESIGEIFKVQAKREVILCAGTSILKHEIHLIHITFRKSAFQNPQFLELSGIGLPSILLKHNIPVKINLPVGEILQEHFLLSVAGVLKDAESLKQTKDKDGKLVLPNGLIVEYIGTGDEDPGKGYEIIRDNSSKMIIMILIGMPDHRTAQLSPFLLTNLQPILSPEPFTELLESLRYLISQTTSPLTKLQYEQQLRRLSDPQSQITDVGFMFDAIPGFVGVPTEDGGMSFWLSVSVFISVFVL
ncbi:GMC oxidoreductase [Sphaerobolus stellatus SS14]|nr:GMC oxidoreductase [Sphaerobolus stellatus SS14]